MHSNGTLILQSDSQVQSLSGENTQSTCVQGGTTNNYECTVTDTSGIGVTFWSGDAFRCVESSDRIALVHYRYDSGLSSICGNFSAIIIGVKRSEYTSRLTFLGDTKLNGTIINCTFSDVLLVKQIVVRVGG